MDTFYNRSAQTGAATPGLHGDMFSGVHYPDKTPNLENNGWETRVLPILESGIHLSSIFMGVMRDMRYVSV